MDQRLAQKMRLRELARVLVSFTDPEECAQFLADLCTPAELQAMTGRWQVALMLEEKISYRKIQALTGVSTATITRVARFLDEGFGGYRQALKMQKTHHSCHSKHQP